MTLLLQDAMAIDYDLTHNIFHPLEKLSPGMQAVLRGIWDGRDLADREKSAEVPQQQR